MPKIKTRNGVAKRFKFTATGKVKYKKSGLRHLLSGKNPRRKIKLKRPATLTRTETKLIKKLLPYG
ncbi:MAG: 50S ribosomal protein L35 [Candidatus Omnitrophica bacterium]|nr:50S ribosomal protein L35 [Candidatus Omnitrophota bacterium]